MGNFIRYQILNVCSLALLYPSDVPFPLLRPKTGFGKAHSLLQMFSAFGVEDVLRIQNLYPFIIPWK